MSGSEHYQRKAEVMRAVNVDAERNITFFVCMPDETVRCVSISPEEAEPEPEPEPEIEQDMPVDLAGVYVEFLRLYGEVLTSTQIHDIVYGEVPTPEDAEASFTDLNAGPNG